MNAQQFDAARTLARTQNPTPAQDAFLEGRILKVQGRWDEAIASFRLSLALDPSDLAARRELAHTLLLSGQYDVAEFHFDVLLDADPNPNMHEDYRRFLNVIAQNKPLGVTGSFAILPSTNINRGTTNTVFDTTSGTFVIDPSSQADSGVGFQLGVSGYARFAQSQQSRWTLTASLFGTGYEDIIHNTATATLGLSYDRAFQNGRWSLAPYTRLTWREGDADQHVTGLRFATSYRVEPRTSLSFAATHEYRDFPNQSYRNGHFDQIVVGLAHQFDPSVVVRGTLSVEQDRPYAAHLQYDGFALGVSLSRTWDGGLATTFSLNAGERSYVGVYPLTTTPRSDDFTKFSVDLFNPRLNVGNFTPRLFCSHTVNTSNVAFYDYDTTECQAVLSTEF